MKILLSPKKKLRWLTLELNKGPTGLRVHTTKFSQWEHPLVHQKGGLWLCVNCRCLNKVRNKNKYTLPPIDGLLDKLYKSYCWFSKIGVASKYNYIHIVEENARKTTFWTQYDQYEFMIMSFGLKNVPTNFNKVDE